MKVLWYVIRVLFSPFYAIGGLLISQTYEDWKREMLDFYRFR